MTGMIDGIDNEPSSGLGDQLQAPQRWYYREWQHLTFAPASMLELGKLVGKVCLLVTATPFCFALGLVGSVVKFCANMLPDSSSVHSSGIFFGGSIIGKSININGKKYGDEKNLSYWYGNIDRAVRGSGKIAEKTYHFDHALHTVEMDSLGDLEILQGDENSLVITAEDNLLDLLRPSASGDTITLGLKRDSAFEAHHTIKYRLTIPHLNHLIVSGSGNVTIPHLNSPHFKCKISGIGSVLVLNGQVDRQDINISGSGAYNASNLSTYHSTIDLRGIGSAKIWAQETLDVTVSGIGSCIYDGKPQITKSISGIGELRSNAPTKFKEAARPRDPDYYDRYHQILAGC